MEMRRHPAETPAPVASPIYAAHSHSGAQQVFHSGVPPAGSVHQCWVHNCILCMCSRAPLFEKAAAYVQRMGRDTQPIKQHLGPPVERVQLGQPHTPAREGRSESGNGGRRWESLELTLCSLLGGDVSEAEL